VLHPAKDGGVGYINAAFAHHGYQVSIAQFVRDVPADIQNDNFLVKVAAPKELFHRYKLWHSYH
jgi:hypothetical protein